MSSDQGLTPEPGPMVPLSALLQQTLPLERKLSIAIGICEALTQFHARGFIHRDIKPSSILVAPDSCAVSLVGSELALQARRRRQAPEPPEMIVGTLAYMAPEQTGRMNRSVDARSDLYALGVVLYRMLVGELPFSAVEPMELVHCHIARAPVPPCERCPELPEMVSAVVMKLLAKVAEDRYQTAAGASADLARCLTYEQTFALGMHDITDRLLIPEKLYGREGEIRALLDAFDGVVSSGRPTLMLVSGYSGVGKSSVVNELHKALVPPRGLFAAGKFDQYRRGIPYVTLAQAFQGLIRMLLAAPEPRLEHFREALRAALGEYGQLVVNLIPELERVIGAQPPVPELAAKDMQNVFEQVIRRFIAVFARPEHPLALFLDDLQWLDAATLELLSHLLLHEEVKHLFLVGAYRDNEVGPDHPLTRKLAALRTAGADVQEIVLAPLTLADVAILTRDALRTDDADELAAMLHRKTGGNPFFMIQFLTTLADDGLLTFDASARRFRWDLTRIASKGFTDNVVALMIERITRLPLETQNAMHILACVGNAARVTTLSRVLDLSELSLHGVLRPAVEAELLTHQFGGYAFLHDRIQEAAYAFVGEAERPGVHLRIGRLLAASTPAHKLDESVFELVSQLNRGSVLVTDQAELDHFAALNLRAGRRSKGVVAHATAIGLLSMGESQLGPAGWERRRELAFALSFELAESQFLSGDIVPAEQRLASLADRASDLPELSAVTCVQISLFMTLAQADRAVEAALRYLKRAGMQFPLRPSVEQANEAYAAMWRALAGREIEQLSELPEAHDADLRATLEVLAAILPPAWFLDPLLPILLMTQIVNLSIEHGNCPASCYGYVMVGMKIGPHFGDYESAYRFAKLGHELVERPGFGRFKPGVYLTFGMFVKPWTRGLDGSIELIMRGFDEAERIGDLTFAVYILCGVDSSLLYRGAPLAECERASRRALDYARKVGFTFVATLVQTKLQLSRMLQGHTVRAGSLDDADFDEQTFEQTFGPHSIMALPMCWYWIRRQQAHLLVGQSAEALAVAKRAGPLVWVSASFIEYAEHHFYAALARAACHDAADAATKAELRAELAANVHQLEVWGALEPLTHGGRALLAAAELARVDGRTSAALELYEQAIDSARRHGGSIVLAVCFEHAARFHAWRGFDRLAAAYLHEARECYRDLGAVVKVEQLEARHITLGPESATPTIQAPLAQLEVTTVVKAAQALASESVLQDLMVTFMRLATEHSGAERALLLLPRADGELRMEAEARTLADGLRVERRGSGEDDALALPRSVLDYALRSGARVSLDDATRAELFAGDAYITQQRPRAVLCLPLINRTRLAGVLYLENKVASHAFRQSGIAVLEVLASLAAIALDRVQGEAALRRSESFLAEGQRLSQTGSFGWNVATGAVVWSVETYRIFEYDPAEPITLAQVLARTHEDDRDYLRSTLDDAAATGANWSLEHRLRMPDGRVKTIGSNATANVGEGGTLEYVGATRDISAAKLEAERLQASLDDREALLKEVHHRVKNNLQLISSLLNLQATRTADPVAVELFADSRNRVRSMALVHENLYRASSFSSISMSDHVETLCRRLVSAYMMGDSRVTLEVRVSDASLSVDRAVSCGLIINELVSNALKHAFPGGRSGTLQVALHAPAPEWLVLEVRDDGVGLPADLAIEDGDTLGLQLVHDLSNQLDGRLSVERQHGTAFAISFPADGHGKQTSAR
jgi:predicted ATPase/two-component sensor histidine kinase